MTNIDEIPAQTFSKTVVIKAPASAVWDALTTPQLMQQWMSETRIEIITDWKVGAPIIIRDASHTTYAESVGTVLQYEPCKALSYSHLSSLSNLSDEPKNYTTLTFTLMPDGQQTTLILTITNFPTLSIYKHFAFYWNVTLELLKRFIEKR